MKQEISYSCKISWVNSETLVVKKSVKANFFIIWRDLGFPALYEGGVWSEPSWSNVQISSLESLWCRTGRINNRVQKITTLLRFWTINLQVWYYRESMDVSLFLQICWPKSISSVCGWIHSIFSKKIFIPFCFQVNFSSLNIKDGSRDSWNIGCIKSDWEYQSITRTTSLQQGRELTLQLDSCIVHYIMLCTMPCF